MILDFKHIVKAIEKDEGVVDLFNSQSSDVLHSKLFEEGQSNYLKLL